MATRAGRYQTGGLVENQSEPGSRGRVLKNLLHITSSRTMQLAEQALLLDSERLFQDHFSATHRFTETDVLTMHREWLKRLYAWAGTYRSVNMTKEMAGWLDGLPA